MRIVLLVLIAATIAMPCAQAAPVYRYCASYEERGDLTCAYDTFQQCLDTARGGEGGMCMENPAWHPEPAAPVRHKAKRRNG
ncbi:MAG TPA: DUF3551 domain-containing protein [Xanthobacteraceae bacterium]|nr:DUF3551 domain-containing protein [Xanthobacteraceae bacterium]